MAKELILYEVEMIGVAREVYLVLAASPEEAVASDVARPVVTECTDMEVRSVKPADGWDWSK